MGNKTCQGENNKKSIVGSQLTPYNLLFFHRAVNYGTWTSVASRTIVNFCEGDVTTTVCESDEEFVAQIRELAAWNDKGGYGPMKIDPGFDDGLRQAFETLGLADLLH